MLYKDFVREKTHHLTRIKSAEGYPCEFDDSKGKALKNYKVYGNSYQAKGKNLIPYPYTTLDGVLVPTTKTESGVTFTINEDRSITINGTATNAIYYHLVSTYGTHVLTLPRAKYYFHDNCGDINSTPRRFMMQAKTMDDSNTFLTTLGEGIFDTSSIQSCKIWLVITINQGDVFENITFKPQLELGSIATEYEPYKVMPSPEFPSEIESVGNKSKNLLNVADYFSNFLDANGNIVFNQSNFSSISAPLLLKDNFKENTQYTLSCTVEISNANSNGIVFHFYDSSGTSLASYACNTTGSNMFKVKITNRANTTIHYARIVYGSSARRCDVKISNFQIEERTSATNYIPYGKYSIPIVVDNKGKNLFGGTAFRDKLMELGGTLNAANKTVTIGADKLQNKVLFDKFDANKRYTFIFRGYNLNTSVANHPSNIKINYSDGTIQNGFFNSTPGKKGTWYYKSIDGFSISNFMGVWNTSSTVFYYEECGIFEGAISLSEFEPYSIIQTNIILDEPLRKHDTYADYIDFKRQKVIRRVGYFKRSADILKSLKNSVQVYGTSKPNAMSWYAKSTIGTSSAKYGYTGAFHWYVTRDTGNLFLFSPAEDMTLGEYFTNLNIQTDVEFIWAMTTPIEEAITLPPLLTQKGSNIITTTTTVTPSKIEVKYVAK